MEQNEVRFRLAAYDWQGKLISDIDYIASATLDIDHQVDELATFQHDIYEQVQQGSFDN